MIKKKHRNFISVKEVINLTDNEIWTYGTSGELLRLRTGRINSPEELEPKPGSYYVVPREIREAILQESIISEDYLLEAQYIGSGRNHVPIYHFVDWRGIKVIPVTEQVVAVVNTTGFLIRPA